MIEDEVDEFILAHFGVKGMRWGVRREGTPGVSSRTDREARKDAKEYARARQFFGEGAGTRRKLIRSTVDAKIARNPAYARAFKAHLDRENQRSDVHASKAISERRRKDVTKRTKQRAGFLARTFTGEMGTQAAFAALALGGAAFLASPKGRQIMSTTLAKAKSAQASRQGVKLVNDFIKSQGR